ncbi:MAG: slipin family protein [Oscillospiraceae bacterium]|nr:slipin family protein [Oscillospiraceae bacterium]
MKIVIREWQRGYLIKNGKFIRLLEAGKHSYYPIFGESVEIVQANGPVARHGLDESILLRDPLFEKSTVKVTVPDNQIALRYVNGRITGALERGEYLFWDIFEKNTFKHFDITDPKSTDGVQPAEFICMHTGLYTKIEVSEGETALLYIGGKLDSELPAGTHYFWNSGRKISHKIVDLKLQQIDVPGQEILTADKVSIRLNFTCNFKITEPVKAMNEINSLLTQLYSFVQLTVREFVGRFRFDELLKQKDSISGGVLEKLKEKEAKFFVEFSEAGIKDIILPGEIREIMNSVLVAEKAAQASVITRREEIASTRSLLETAKLMEENELLYKLKEMEYIERICDKAGSISLGGNNVLEELRRLVARD